jgi:hypothetical protein
MRRTFYASTLALMLAAPAIAAVAQTGGNVNPRRPAPPPKSAQTQPAAVIPLPASDAVLTVDLRRLLTEVVPRVLASDPARLAQVTSDIEQFKSRTGIDARDFSALTVGTRITRLPSGATKFERTVALAAGTFRADALVAAARAASKGTLAEQTYGGKAVYVLAVNDELKLFGLLKMHVKELALSVLAPNMLAVGEPESVRAAIDAQAGRGRADLSLLDFPKSADDFIGFAGNVPAGVLAGMDTGLPNVDRAVASIRSFYGSIGSTPAGVRMTTVLRAQTAGDAKQLYETAEAIRRIAPGLITMAGEKAKFAKGLIDSLKITTKGNEVQLHLEVPQADISTLLRAL